MVRTEPEYIGDGVYASIENGIVKLSTERFDRDPVNDVVYLDLEGIAALVRFAERSGIDVRSMTTKPKE